MEIKIGVVENAQHYLDVALKRGKKRMTAFTIKNSKLESARKFQLLEKERISTIKQSLYGDLTRIMKAFPHTENFDEVTIEIFSHLVDIDHFKMSLANVSNARETVVRLTESTIQNISRSKTSEAVITAQKAYIGRIASVLKKLDKSLLFLEKARYSLRDFPTINPNMGTVCIAGFPNVGKSTLLGKITSSHPEINSYAFTTKGLMVGYLKGHETTIQVLDTPGTLNRYEKMNHIEKMAEIALNRIGSLIVYVVDFTEPYAIGEQIELLENIKKINKPLIIYFSKADVIPEQVMKECIEKHNIQGIADSEVLIQEIIKQMPVFEPKVNVEDENNKESNEESKLEEDIPPFDDEEVEE